MTRPIVALSESEARALLVLVKRVYATCANLGDELWSTRLTPGNCSCPFARPAGAVIMTRPIISKARRRPTMSREEVKYPPLAPDSEYEPLQGPRCGNAACRTCPRWKCWGCNRRRPWCVGAGDGSNLCDDCWAEPARMKRRDKAEARAVPAPGGET